MRGGLSPSDNPAAAAGPIAGAANQWTGARLAKGAHGPVDFAALCALFDDLKGALPRKLAEAAAFLLAHPDDVAFGPLTAIAARTGISPSAFVRLAQDIGYDGFSQMQAVFRRRLAMPDDPAADPGEYDALGRVVQATARSLKRFDDRTDRLMLEKAVRLLVPAHTVFLVGQDHAAPSALYLAHVLTMAGIRNIHVEGGPDRYEKTLAFASDRDAVITIDFYPSDPHVLSQASRLMQRCIPFVLLTDSRLHPLAGTEAVWFELVDEMSFGVRGLASLMCLTAAIVGPLQDRRHPSPCS